MSGELMVNWLRPVWGQRSGAMLPPSLLIVDSFCGHLEEMRTDIAAILGGPTSMLQLDVSINRPFEDNVRRLYMERMAKENRGLTPPGKMRRPSIDTLC